MNKLFIQLLKQRGFTESFLHPKYEDLSSPSDLKDMQKAVTRIKRAIKNQEKVLIYGDYDVDGITASTVMEQALTLAGLKDITIMLPDRFVDGYGMSARLVEKAKQLNITLVITVDCGSRNLDIIDQLAKNHIDTIITDHHECGDTLPRAVAVINPKRPDQEAQECQETQETQEAQESPKNHATHELAGVGVAFKLAQALAEDGIIPNGQEKWLLDLVLIGTLCDRMELSPENRILCYYGLIVLAKTRRPGLKELMKTAKVNPTKITADSIGFQLGPRLNAAGRLETAEIALNLLRTTSATEAAALAQQLEQLNQKRRAEQTAAIAEITKKGIKNDPVIIEAGTWHEGIIGIVAGRLTEQYHRPAFVLTKVEGGVYKGSGRSFGDFNLAEALAHAKDTILSGGGHAAAAGVRVAEAELNNFCTQINTYYRSLHLENQEKYLAAHPDLVTDTLKDFNLELLEDLRTLEPFGPGNPEPIFCIKNLTISGIRRMGQQGQHLRLDVKDRENRLLKLVAFSAPERWFALDQYQNYDFIIQPVENEYNGLRSVEGRLLDVHSPGSVV